MSNNPPKKVPYISFSTKRLPLFLELVKLNEEKSKGELLDIISHDFSRTKKTILEFIGSLKNLNLLYEMNGHVKLSDSAIQMVQNPKKFWDILRRELLKEKIISEILEAIILLSNDSVRVKSNDNYYDALAEFLIRQYDFTSVSPRELDRFITLFRRIKLLDYDQFSDEYFAVKIHNPTEDFMIEAITEKVKELEPIMYKKTGTSWIPIDYLRSEVCTENGITIKSFDNFLEDLNLRSWFQFAEASASRIEVAKGGIKKNDEIYYYLKMSED